MTRIMVTGGAGFLGTPVVRRFREAGHDVFVPRSASYDLRKKSQILEAFADSDPEIVVHLAAAVGGIGANAAEPGRFFYDNAIMGLQVMETARWWKVKKFITVGTVCEYPEYVRLPFREKDLWNGYPTPVTAPYGLAKKMLLVQAQTYREEYGFDSVHLIPVNLYGPGDNFDPDSGHVVAGLIRKIIAAKLSSHSTVTCWGSGRASREFLYVEDAARAIVLATEKYSGNAPVNIGTGVETRIETLVSDIARLCEYEGLIVWDTSQPDGQLNRQLDVSRAESEFDFRAEMPLDEGLRRTIEWYVNS